MPFSRWELELLGPGNSGTLSETKGARHCALGRGLEGWGSSQ